MLRLRFSACLILLLQLGGIVAAQPYSVRVTYNTNLRTSYSLESRVAATVPAGTTLQVVGNFNRWLNISRNGNFWMADWVPHTRVDGGAASSDINNCCFVDRQCNSDQEWVNGYWAFQRNECPVGSVSTVETSAQPISSTPAEVDNCCFTGWQCHSNADWDRGYWAYQNNQCSGNQANTSTFGSSGRHGNIIIEGSESFHSWVNAGLELLRTKAPEWYSYVLGATRKIRELPYGAGAGVFVESGTHETAWGVDWIPSDLNIHTIAHEMVHEACHIYQYLSSREHSGWRAEKECVQKQLEATQVFDPYDRFGRHGHWRWIIANIEHDRSIWWWH